MALRTIKSSAESKDQAVFAHFEKPSRDSIQPDFKNININDVMQNMSAPQFTYETFKQSYDASPQIQELVDDFNSQGIKINTGEVDDEQSQANQDDSNSVTQMAKSATDLSDSPLG